MSSVDFVIGFIAGEATFGFNTKRNSGKWYCRPYFKISLDSSDDYLLAEVREVFGGLGKFYEENERSVVRWEIHNKQDLNKLKNRIISEGSGPWFASKKYEAFKTWVKIVDIYSSGDCDDQDRVNMTQIAINEGLNTNSGHKDANYGRVIKWYSENRNVEPQL